MVLSTVSTSVPASSVRSRCLPFIYSAMFAEAELGRSVATLYLDTEAAYYPLTRQLAFGNLTTDDAVVRVFPAFWPGAKGHC